MFAASIEVNMQNFDCDEMEKSEGNLSSLGDF